ncbi:MAG: LPS export ABC transporter periplasmic protein LptC [Desulfobulbus sp.]|nr:LPS export ABC transporter periplasmic protein LptC [Desulfobulbus sp.]
MVRNPRNLLWLVPLAFFVASPVWHPLLSTFLTPRGGYNPKLAQPQEESPMENFVMDRVAITLTSKGMEEWQIDAERAFTGAKEHEIDMEEVRAMYIGNTKEPIDIQSRKGAYRVDTRFLVLTDHVKISKPTKNQVLLSDRLEYDDTSKKLVSPGKVYIQAPNMKIDAGHLNYDFSTEGFDFTDRVKVIL